MNLPGKTMSHPDCGSVGCIFPDLCEFFVENSLRSCLLIMRAAARSDLYSQHRVKLLAIREPGVILAGCNEDRIYGINAA